MTVTIARAYEHRFEQSNETKPALDFSDFDQSLALNKTQVVALIEAFGPDVRLWIGQTVSLLAVPSNYQGKPTILITTAESAPSPTFNGQSVRPGNAADTSPGREYSDAEVPTF